jgi:23S rRNA (cytidine1920-2'-O)/16S rRNA (cytidine1409-2'-O)-methyltransferase
MADQRLDAALAARGLARSRTHAASLIAAGLVTVEGQPAIKPSVRVADDARVEVEASDHYVSRAAHKLIAALDAFEVDPSNRVVLDAGASTGGFSQVLLERGARRVLAVDVGHGQLAPELLGAPGLVLVEGCNVRNLDAARLAALTGVEERPSLVTADLSFISLTTVLPALRATALDDAEFVLLVKPQFEVYARVSCAIRRSGRKPSRTCSGRRSISGSARPASRPPQSSAATETSSTSCTSAP